MAASIQSPPAGAPATRRLRRPRRTRWTISPLRHLAREALQSLVVHGFSPIVAGDTRLNIRPIDMVFDLEMRCRMGQTLSQPNQPNQRLGGVLRKAVSQRSDALASQVQHMLLIPEHENKVTG